MSLQIFIARMTFILFVVGTCPLLDYLGLRSSILSIGISVFGLMILFYCDKKIAIPIILMSIGSLIVFGVYSIYWGDIKLFLYPIYLVFSVIYISLLKKEGWLALIKYLFVYILTMLVFSFLSFFYFIVGGKALYQFANPDGRINSIYLFAFSNSSNGLFIRPSGFFDEPGALAFHLAMILSLRRIFKLNSRWDWICLSLGFVTLSLAHIIFSCFYVMTSFVKLRTAIITSVLLVLLTSTVVFFLYDSPMGNYLSGRLTVNDDGSIRGDNRSDLFLTAYSFVNTKTILFGLSSKCITDYSVCSSKYEDMGENPLSPLVFMGAILSSPYYIFITALILIPKGIRFKMIGLACSLMFMQRPYLFHLGYCIWSACFGVILYHRFNVEKIKSNSVELLNLRLKEHS